MYETIAIVLPVFGLIGIGYAGSLVGLANDRMTDGLTDFLCRRSHGAPPIS